MADKQQAKEPIAVIGTACRFAGGANSASELAQLLKEPRHLHQEIPKSRFNIDAFYHPDGSYHGHTNVKHAYFVEDDVAAFDAEFFEVKAVEAKAMDPQQRMLMEVAFEALESAGLQVSELRGSDTAVFVGSMVNDYSTMLLRDLQQTPTYYATGTGSSILANRLSYYFNWHGPSVTVDTACSSSLVSIHMALQSLRSGESRVALAAGSNLILGPENFVIESKLNMLSPDGLSKMWDQDANGYARGEGVAAVILKTLSAAIADGDHIECLIRETGVNQDGASAGITMPSSEAQEALIRATYARAGLDLLSPKDRPQYFEAHGTGTPAGDPKEAEAIYNAFNKSIEQTTAHPLYVGSIKTLIGHTESTAGIAGIMKASLAMQKGFLPPNLLLNKLHKDIEPFYKNVELVQSAKPWPETEGLVPRRASVNSFGFGGTNAHAIVEGYVNDQDSTKAEPDDKTTLFAPFVFSAASQSSLRDQLSAYLEKLEEETVPVSRDLSWTLHSRRSAFPHRIAFAETSSQGLISAMKDVLSREGVPLGVEALPQSSGKILGVFTGQGAQYPRMGAELMAESKKALEIIEDLELALSELPDGPKWSLKSELLAAADSSRIHEAAISQPLCTAVQILLVRLLAEINVHFDAVVGHSSGEIAAAYAAGYLSARDAIRVAYYRGYHLDKACSPNGADKKGAMLAVGSSREDVEEICQDEVFAGRICIAASNSDNSVTVSGDSDAIEELQVVLSEESKFNRLLKVDRAYHSNHMLPCTDAYVASLRACGVKDLRPLNPKTKWISSVHDRQIEADMDLGADYWAQNMTKPVLFAEALRTLLGRESFDVALEVGSHPALKGPATQVMTASIGKAMPYSGLLSRDTSAVQALSAGLGFLWAYLGPSVAELARFEALLSGNTSQPCVLKGLPKYSWSHKNKYWHESRNSRKTRLRVQKVNSLIGDASADSAPHHLMWKNLLSVKEMGWLEGHRVQGQVVFPAAGYLSSALEAAKSLTAKYTSDSVDIRLVELENFIIHQAVAFPYDSTEVEVLIELADIVKSQDLIRAKFTYSAALGRDQTDDDLTLAAECDVLIHLGPAAQDLLPRRKAPLTHTVDVDTERFYTHLAGLGYEFAGRFKSLSSLQRKHLRATSMAKFRALEHNEDALLVHPAELDSVIQSVILAYSYPYDDQLRTLHLPTSIKTIRFNPAILAAGAGRTEDEDMPLDSSIRPSGTYQRGITGDVDLIGGADKTHVAIQVQGATFMPMGSSTAEQDRRVFSKVHWINSQANGLDAGRGIEMGEAHIQMVCLLERIATYYLRQFEESIPDDSPLRTEFPSNWYLNYARYVTGMVKDGHHKWAKEEWLQDTIEDIMEMSKTHADTPDVQIMHLVGEHMPRVFRGETTILEEFRRNDILDRYYATGFGLTESGQWVSRSVKQLSDLNPHMRILEVGAGTGGATKSIFREINTSFDHYTYTDISAAFFENAASIFPQHKNKMDFKTFNAENEPAGQGFELASYDLVVAFFVIHAVSDLEKALLHIRSLLKPGGRLVVGEGQEGENGVASSGFIFGTLPGWWLGTDKGRVLSPHVSPQGWDDLLRKCGFSGIQSKTPDEFVDILNVFHFSAQAVDAQVDFYRQPLLSNAWVPEPMDKLLIVGGATPRSQGLIKGTLDLLKPYAKEIVQASSLIDVDYDNLGENATVVCLADLDQPVFKDIQPATFEALKSMYGSKKTLLWVTSGRLDDEPYSNMVVGFGRTAQHEMPDLRLQQLDIADPETVSPEAVADVVLRFYTSGLLDTSYSVPEPEILIDNEGKQLVPRLRPIKELNDRYNSTRRHVQVLKSAVSEQPFVLEPSWTSAIVKQMSRYAPGSHSSKTDMLRLRAISSTYSQLRTKEGHKFLVLGQETESGKSYLALVSTLASEFEVKKQDTALCADTTQDPASLLHEVSSRLVAASIIEQAQLKELLVVHQADIKMRRALEKYAAEKEVELLFTVSSNNTDDNQTAAGLVYELSAYPSFDEVVDVLPKMPTTFIGLSDPTSPSHHSEVALMSCLPDSVKKTTVSELYSVASTRESFSAELVNGSKLLSDAMLTLEDSSTTQSSVSLSDVVNNKSESRVDCRVIVDWTPPSSDLPLSLRRLDSEPMFKGANSTYWIVGMTGALGISLVDWMINKGARNVVMTSRNPKVEAAWIEAHKRKGANVLVLACNVASEADIQAAHKQIVETLPPIAGVMNGAMVLRDTSIQQMTYENLTDVIKPKVNGSIHLDRIFHDVDLDFFVLISSINCVVGNLGQANYAAANTFMCALAAQRRKRGLRAATVNSGAIIGAGYMERESRRALDMIVQKLNMMRLSEEDWCQTICEAIDASRLESDVGAELTTGLSDVAFDTPSAPYWFTNPKFSDFICRQESSASTSDEKKGAVASVKDQLAEAESEEQVFTIVQAAFASQLRNVLQSQATDEGLMNSTSKEIGLDSLVSVDIRSWFLKKLNVNIPVLKIMSIDLMSGLVDYAVENLARDLVPLLPSSDSADSGGSGATSPTIGSSNILTPHISTGATTPVRMPEHGDDKQEISTSDSRKIKTGEVDWAAETTPPADFADIKSDASPTPVNPPNVIVLTGVSGLLGHNLLDYLLEHTTAQKIICIAVRNLSARRKRGEIKQDDRVTYYEGDLTQPTLGLLPEQAAQIFSEADVVVHNGADTSHLKFYRDLKVANVGSTQTLIRWCLPRKIPFHYISSAGVAVLYNQSTFPPVRVTGSNSMLPAADGTFGYMCSKWVNEKCLERVHESHGLPVTIHRPSTIMRHGDDATNARAELDWVNALLSYSRKVKAVPDIKYNRGSLDLVSMETCCSDILRAIMDDSERARDDVTYVHEVGDLVIPMNDMHKLAEEDHAEFDIVPLAEWIEVAVEAGLHPAIGALIEMMDAPGAPDYPRLLKA